MQYFGRFRSEANIGDETRPWAEIIWVANITLDQI